MRRRLLTDPIITEHQIRFPWAMIYQILKPIPGQYRSFSWILQMVILKLLMEPTPEEIVREIQGGEFNSR